MHNYFRSLTIHHMSESKVPTRSEFVTMLRRHRLAKGLTQTALARKLDVEPSTVSFWESGTTIPRASMIPKLARLLGIDPMTLTRVLEPEMNAASKN